MDVIEIMHSTMAMAIRISLPFLLISMIVGVIIAIFQAATQINEQTMTFVPKLLAIFFLMGILGKTILNLLGDFTIKVFNMI